MSVESALSPAVGKTGPKPGGTLWVCWQRPQAAPPTETPVLSFLSPGVEEDFCRECPGPVISAREVSQEVRREALKLYQDLVASLGVTPLSGEKTFRQSLGNPGEASPWWYHPVSFKDCETDSTFNSIIALMTINHTARQRGATRLVLVGATWEIAAVLAGVYETVEINVAKPKVWRLWLKSLGSRLKHLLILCRDAADSRRFGGTQFKPMEVALFGFWDWSVGWEKRRNSLWDRYFQALPGELARLGIGTQGWLVWLDLKGPGRWLGRRRGQALAGLRHCPQVTVLQSLLQPREIYRALADFRPLAKYLKVRRKAAFKKMFQVSGMDLLPLFSGPLLAGILDASLPRHRLVLLAVRRAIKQYNPRLAVSFLEHHLFARACYAGVRQAGVGTAAMVVQHANYSHEKTFLHLHPILEFQGEPDGCATPHPDYVCALGRLGYDLFRESGYPEANIFLTGSPRYDHILSLPAHGSRTPGKPRVAVNPQNINLLMLAGLDVNQELEMVEAVCLAVKNLPHYRLRLREHPMAGIQARSDFTPYRRQVQITSGSLAEDLEGADLIVFTYSTTGDEAFIQGKPVWQWLTWRYNGSSLAETGAIPQFASVVSLRQALMAFQQTPAAFLPSRAERRRVLAHLFCPSEAGESPSTRIAALIRDLIQTRGVPGN